MGTEVKEFKLSVPMLIWAVVITSVLTIIGNFFIYFLPSVAACNQNFGDRGQQALFRKSRPICRGLHTR